MKLLFRLGVLLGFLLLPGLAHAQRTITCESGPRGARVYCEADTRGGVTLMRPRDPRARCQQGVQWGFDARGIWVEGGCAAEFQVQQYRGGPVWWDSGRGHRPEPYRGVGACFYRDPGFGGAYFCMNRGETIDALPPGFNDAITSIQIVRARAVEVFTAAGYSGRSARFSGDVGNLKAVRIPGTHDTWNNRISSVRVN